MRQIFSKKSTLFLLLTAVALWSFYFWWKYQNDEFIYETQAFVHDYFTVSENFKDGLNENFITRAERSFFDSVYLKKVSVEDTSIYRFDYKNYQKDYFEKTFYNSIPSNFSEYLESVADFELEFCFRKKWVKDFEYDNKERSAILNKIKNQLDELKSNSLAFENVELPSVNWNEKNDIIIWLELLKQKEQLIRLRDSIISENQKKFPTSYASNNFEGYTTIISNYAEQNVLLKVYWFPSDTKMYDSLGVQKIFNRFHQQQDNFFKFEDSLYWEMKSPTTYHTFDKAGDTILFPIFTEKELNKMDDYERSFYEIPFKVIPDTSIQNEN